MRDKSPKSPAQPHALDGVATLLHGSSNHILRCIVTGMTHRSEHDGHHGQRSRERERLLCSRTTACKWNIAKRLAVLNLPRVGRGIIINLNRLTIEPAACLRKQAEVEAVHLSRSHSAKLWMSLFTVQILV